MLLFFYGADGYRSFQKLQDLKSKYIDASLGDTNLTIIDVTAIKAEDLAPQILAFPFLAKTRLVVLPGLLSKGSKSVQEKFESLVTKIPETTVAVVYEPGIPDRRTVLFKLLKKTATTQEFESLVGSALNQWISQLLQPFGATIMPAAREQLIGLMGTNSWRLATELTKLATSLMDKPVAKRQITAELVTSLVTGSPEVSVFALTDAIVSGKEDQVVKQLRHVVEQGENEQYLIAMVGSTLRSLALVRNGLDQGASSSSALATATGLKPFVIGKQLSTAKRVTLLQLTDLYCDLVKLDAGLKNGTMQVEVGLELLLIRATAQLSPH